MLFMAELSLFASPILWAPAVAELEPVDSLEGSCCAIAPASGNAARAAASSIEREIEIIAIPPFAPMETRRVFVGWRFRTAAHAESSWLERATKECPRMIRHFAPTLTRLGVLMAHPAAFVVLIGYVGIWLALSHGDQAAEG